ncbi:MAG: hypothetical protein NZM04_05390 [Methylacidiphilales bacterium]|nr:hypothetical protein [Candidatus Methylacidiphilales bacterium]
MSKKSLLCAACRRRTLMARSSFTLDCTLPSILNTTPSQCGKVICAMPSARPTEIFTKHQIQGTARVVLNPLVGAHCTRNASDSLLQASLEDAHLFIIILLDPSLATHKTYRA